MHWDYEHRTPTESHKLETAGRRSSHPMSYILGIRIPVCAHVCVETFCAHPSLCNTQKSGIFCCCASFDGSGCIEACLCAVSLVNPMAPLLFPACASKCMDDGCDWSADPILFAVVAGLCCIPILSPCFLLWLNYEDYQDPDDDPYSLFVDLCCFPCWPSLAAAKKQREARLGGTHDMQFPESCTSCADACCACVTCWQCGDFERCCESCTSCADACCACVTCGQLDDTSGYCQDHDTSDDFNCDTCHLALCAHEAFCEGGGSAWNTGLLCCNGSCDSEGCLDTCCCLVTVVWPGCGLLINPCCVLREVRSAWDDGAASCCFLLCAFCCILWVPPVLATWTCIWRTQLRNDNNIVGSIPADCCVACCCFPVLPGLAVAQLVREARVRGDTQFQHAQPLVSCLDNALPCCAACCILASKLMPRRARYELHNSEMAPEYASAMVQYQAAEAYKQKLVSGPSIKFELCDSNGRTQVECRSTYPVSYTLAHLPYGEGTSSESAELTLGGEAIAPNQGTCEITLQEAGIDHDAVLFLRGARLQHPENGIHVIPEPVATSPKKADYLKTWTSVEHTWHCCACFGGEGLTTGKVEPVTADHDEETAVDNPAPGVQTMPSKSLNVTQFASAASAVRIAQKFGRKARDKSS